MRVRRTLQLIPARYQAVDRRAAARHRPTAAVVEALAAGVPVLISNRVNIWREIEADRAGFVESDNLDGTTRLLQRWIDTPELEMNY